MHLHNHYYDLNIVSLNIFWRSLMYLHTLSMLPNK
nr:MAG TPA: hypothetical protein [Caudoviricetes sp.]